MSKEIISGRQGIALVAMFIWGSTLIVGSAGEAKKDMWLAIILGMIFAAVIFILYCKIIYSFPGKSIFDINKLVFGTLLGSFFNMAYIWFAYSLGAMILNNFTEFISVVGMPDSPRAYGIVPLIVICIWGVKAGIEVLGRLAEFFLILIVAIMITSTTLSIPSMELYRIVPVGQEGLMPILKGAFSAFSFPFAETVLMLMISSSFNHKRGVYRTFIIGLIISGGFITVFAVRNLLVIGEEMLSRSYFPSYTALSRIDVGEFVQRIETVVTVSFLLTGFIKISICILGACIGLANMFKLDDYNILVTPVSLTMFATSFIVYDSIMESIKFTQSVSPYYKVIFQIIIPVITYAAIKIRRKKILNT